MSGIKHVVTVTVINDISECWDFNKKKGKVFPVITFYAHGIVSFTSLYSI